jgi:hypothetical protein
MNIPAITSDLNIQWETMKTNAAKILNMIFTVDVLTESVGI